MHLFPRLTAAISLLALALAGPSHCQAQHRVVTLAGDTLNCRSVEADYELGVTYLRPAGADTVLRLASDDIAAVKYHAFPPYPDAAPRLAAGLEYGVHFARHDVALGHAATRPLLKEGLRRGASYRLQAALFPRERAAVSAFGEYAAYANGNDTLWVRGATLMAGAGISTLLTPICNELFFTAHAQLFYATYHGRGRIPGEDFDTRNAFGGIRLAAEANLHISNTVAAHFGGGVYLAHKSPDDLARRFRPRISGAAVSFGLACFIGQQGKADIESL